MNQVHLKYPYEEVKDSFSKSSAWRKRRFFSSGTHIYKSYTTLQRVHFYFSSASFSSPSKSWKMQKIPPYTYLLLSEFSPFSGSNNQDYSCTYSLGIEHVSTVEKGRDRNRERDQGQPETRASPEKVEKEVKKTRETSHPKKFEARAPDGHHRDCILLLFIELAWKAPLFVFLFSF